MEDDVQLSEGKVEELQTDPDNANTHTERGMFMLERSLRERGFGRPVVADKNKRLIGGEAATLTALDVGFEDAVFVHTQGDKVVVHVRDDLELGVDEAARELSIEDNRIGQVNLRFDVDRLKAYRDKGVDLTKWWTARELKAVFDMTFHEGDDGGEGATDADGGEVGEPSAQTIDGFEVSEDKPPLLRDDKQYHFTFHLDYDSALLIKRSLVEWETQTGQSSGAWLVEMAGRYLSGA